MYKIFLNLLLLIISCIMISCEHRQDYWDNIQKFKKWNQHQSNLSKIIHYQINGVLMCSLLHKKEIHTRFFFQKMHKYDRLIISDFFGFANIEINLSENRGCFIHNKVKNCLSWHDFEMQVKKLTNISFPLNNLQKWILGLPGNTCDFHLSNDGYLKKVSFQHDSNNFTILYKSYFYDKIPILPKIIEIYCNDNYYFNIKIYRWIIF